MPLPRHLRNRLIHQLAAAGVSSSSTMRRLSRLGHHMSIRHLRRVASSAGAPFSHPQRRRQPNQAVVDGLYRQFAQENGYNYGLRYVLGVLHDENPHLRFSYRATARAMRNVNPVATAIRRTQANRRLVRRGAFHATKFMELWQSDMNWVLERWGLGHSIIYDVGTHSCVRLKAMAEKLTVTLWKESHEPIVRRLGFPRMWTTDKGTETYLTAFVVRCVARAANRSVAGHRFLPSKLQSGVERFNGEINVKVNLPLKLVLIYMEAVLNILDPSRPYHLGACQILGREVLQHADDNLARAWDVHTVRHRSGRGLGKPRDLRRANPAPAQAPQRLPAGIDYISLYEQANGRQLRREPLWAAARDPLYGQPARQALRAAAVVAYWGTMSQVWSDILHNTGRARFIPGFVAFLQYQ